MNIVRVDLVLLPVPREFWKPDDEAGAGAGEQRPGAEPEPAAEAGEEPDDAELEAEAFGEPEEAQVFHHRWYCTAELCDRRDFVFFF